jgi:hypothetical protein
MNLTTDSDAGRLEAARHLHRPRIEEGVAWTCAEGECEHEQCHNGGEFVISRFKVCSHCMELADLSGLLEEFWPNWVLWPCKTAEALYEDPAHILPPRRHQCRPETCGGTRYDPCDITTEGATPCE